MYISGGNLALISWGRGGGRAGSSSSFQATTQGDSPPIPVSGADLKGRGRGRGKQRRECIPSFMPVSTTTEKAEHWGIPNAVLCASRV